MNRSQPSPEKPPTSVVGSVLVVIAIFLILDGLESIFDYHTDVWHFQGEAMMVFGVLILGVATVVRQLTRIEFELRRK